MVYRIDIDGTICSPSDGAYEAAVPYRGRIERLNKLYDAGNIIILETGRHWNHFEYTRTQLKEWGVKYHTLIMGKPVCDCYVDDLAEAPNKFFGDNLN